MVNPFLYSLLSKRFRRGFHDLVRNTKIWFRKLPIVVGIKIPTSGARESDRIGPDLPTIHSSSQQRRECLKNNMCCTGTVIKKTVYRWKTNSKMIQDARASIYLSPNINSGENGNKDMIEMAEIPESTVFIRHSNKNTPDFEHSVSTVTTKKKNMTLRFDPYLVTEQTSKSEGGATRSTNACSILYRSNSYKGKRIVSEGSSHLRNIDTSFTKEIYKAKSNSCDDFLPNPQKTVSTAFECNKEQKCLP